jgi:GNAT superfamily N-acetyltransferase
VTVLGSRLPKLVETDDLSDFRCGAAEIDDWLKRHAWKGQILGNANVFVRTHEGRVFGFYAIATGGVEHLAAPRPVRQNAPDPVPVLLLARLGVHLDAHGRGLGKELLQDCLLRALEIHQQVAFRALLIHCRDETARDFYKHVVPSFRESPTNELHLFLPLAALATFASTL